MASLLEFIKALPILMDLFKELHKNAEKKGKAKLAKEDAKKLAEAIKNKDEKAIRDIFNS